MRKNIIILILLLFMPCSLSFTADFTSGDKNSIINWSRGIIVSRGRASINDLNGLPGEKEVRPGNSINRARMAAYDMARDTAIDNLISSIKSIRIDSDMRLIDLIREDNFAQKRISGIIMHSIRTRIYPVDFFSAECEATLKMGDIIASLPYNFPADDYPGTQDSPLSTEYSGLIIDCRNSGVKPMIFPSVYTEDGLEIYGRHLVDMRHASDKGMASYCFSEDEAFKNGRSGKHPYYTSAVKSIKNCPVISENAYRRISGSRKTINNLKKCNVIIILNK
jgi:hypothetical protein